MVSKDAICEAIVDFFCRSRDFNGIPLTDICEALCEECFKELPDIESLSDLPTEVLLSYARPCKGASEVNKTIRIILKDLVYEGRVSVVYDINPHIKRLPDRPVERQLEWLDTNFLEMCAYPSRAEVLKKKNLGEYQGSPYKMRSWECEANMTPVYFDLEVLENYANDPRYTFRWHDVQGSIFLSDAYYESLEMKPRDQTYLEHFGLGFRKSDGQRVVSVPLIYLSRLTPEHQQRWKTFEETDDCVMDPDYYKSSIIGQWATEVPIYSAILQEIETINKLCSAAKLPPMFNQIFKGDQRPKYFRIPFRNTKEAFHISVQEIDKIISQNLNKKFFEAVLQPQETYRIVKHKKTGADVVEEFGTLVLITHWIKTRFQFERSEDQKETLDRLSVFNEVRKIRQSPAHKIEKDEHSRTFSDVHDDLLFNVYLGLKSVRMIFSSHPNIDEDVDIPNWLLEGKVRLFSWKGTKED